MLLINTVHPGLLGLLELLDGNGLQDDFMNMSRVQLKEAEPHLSVQIHQARFPILLRSVGKTQPDSSALRSKATDVVQPPTRPDADAEVHRHSRAR